MRFEPADQAAAVVAIAPDQLDRGKDLLQRLAQAPGTFLVGLVGTGDLDREQMALRIYEQVPFPTPDFFSPRRSLSLGHARHWF